MEKKELFNYLMEEMEIESIDSIDENTNLKDLDEWDSMVAMILISFADEHFNVKLTNKDIEQISTVKSYIDKLGMETFK